MSVTISIHICFDSATGFYWLMCQGRNYGFSNDERGPDYWELDNEGQDDKGHQYDWEKIQEGDNIPAMLVLPMISMAYVDGANASCAALTAKLAHFRKTDPDMN